MAFNIYARNRIVKAPNSLARPIDVYDRSSEYINAIVEENKEWDKRTLIIRSTITLIIISALFLLIL